MLGPVVESGLLPIYLLTGGDRPKIRRALERLRAHFGSESIETLTAESTSGDEAVAAMNSLGLFAGDGGRLVIVEEVERWKKEDEAAIAGYARDPVQGAVLALVRHVDDALGADGPVVADLLEAVLRRGTGSVHQRRWVGENHNLGAMVLRMAELTTS